jgi:hypothetical protein
MINYKRGKCGCVGVKLWRDVCMIATACELICAKCVAVDVGLPDLIVDGDGKHEGKYGPSDQIYNDGSTCWLPAIPTVEMNTYWGYTSVPPDRVKWWIELPTYVEEVKHA